MKGFPGFVKQAAAPKSLPPAPLSTPASKPATLPMPALRPAATPVVVPQGIAVTRPAPAVVRPMVPSAMPASSGLRPVTVATVSRNLLAALGPAAAATPRSPQAFPGFVSRQFNHVQQYRPTTSSAGHLNNLANLFSAPPAAPERRGTLPQPAPKGRLARVLQPSLTAARLAENRPIPQAPLKKTATPANSRPAPRPSLDKPHVAAAKPHVAAAKPQLAAPKVSLTPVAVQSANLKPGLARATEPVVQPPLVSAPPKAAVVAPTQPAPLEAKAPQEKAATQKPQVASKTPTVPCEKKALTASPTKPTAAPIASTVLKTEATKAYNPSLPSPEVQPQRMVSEGKVTPLAAIEINLSEAQRQQSNPLRPASQRDLIGVAESCGLGLSPQSGHGQGGGGGQQQQQRQEQKEESEEESEDVFQSAGGLGQLLQGGRQEVQWWHLQGANRKVPSDLTFEMDWLSSHQAGETALAFSSELREATQPLRARPFTTPALAVAPEGLVKAANQRAQGQFSDAPPQQQQQQQEEAVRPSTAGEVSREISSALCSVCGVETGPLDPRRCPRCLQANALETLRLFEVDGNHLAYRVFMTHCPLPVASRAVYHLRDFAAVPRSAYWVQARQLAA